MARAVVVCGLALAAQACLVTDTKRYPQLDESETVLVVRTPPIDEIVRLAELEGDGDGGTGGADTLPLRVDVIDANVYQTLEYRVFLTGGPTVTTPAECPPGVQNLRFCGTLTNDDLDATRSVSLAIPLADFGTAPDCVRVELRVAEGFDGLAARGQLARAVWWVDVSGEPASLLDCPDPLPQ